MVTYQNVQQATGQIFANPNPPIWVGTEGGVTCLQISCQVAGQGAFVAHADCDQQVHGSGDDFNYVRDTMAGLLLTALGAYNSAVHTQLQSFTGGTDDACVALQAGWQQWAGGTAPPVVAQDSFRVKTDGTGMTWVKHADVGNVVVGNFNMRVPIRPPQ